RAEDAPANGLRWQRCPPLVPVGQRQCGSSRSMFIPGTTDCCAKGDTNVPDYVPYKPFGSIKVASHSDTSNYNSLQVTMRRNVSTGLTLLANYTWSKTLGYTTSFQGVVDPFDSHRDYGFLPWDRSQLLNFSYIYQLPAVATRHNWNRLARGALDSWQISGITRYQAGSPLVPTIASISCHDLTQDLNPRVFNSDFNECGYNGNKGYKPYFHNGQSQFSGGSIGWYGTNDIALAPTVHWSSAGGRTAGTHWVNPYSSLTLPGVTNFGTFETPIMR